MNLNVSQLKRYLREERTIILQGRLLPTLNGYVWFILYAIVTLNGYVWFILFVSYLPWMDMFGPFSVPHRYPGILSDFSPTQTFHSHLKKRNHIISTSRMKYYSNQDTTDFTNHVDTDPRMFYFYDPITFYFTISSFHHGLFKI
jgi:hypothetical protein